MKKNVDWNTLPPFFNPSLLAELLDISKSRAYALARTQGFPSIRLGRRLVISREGLKAWLEQQFQAK